MCLRDSANVLQSPVVKGVELVNGGYGIKNPILTHGPAEVNVETFGKIQGTV